VVQRSVGIASRVGLHAHPAALFTKAATATGIPITICKPGGQPVPATSILSVLTLKRPAATR
jgi:phosphocarrier protein HPr